MAFQGRTLERERKAFTQILSKIMAKYFVQIRKKQGFVESLESSETEFEKLKNAKKNLLSALSTEENLQLVLLNYVEMEKAVFDISINWAISSSRDWSMFQDGRMGLNLKFNNFLSISYFYFLYLKRIFSDIYGKNANKHTTIKEKIDQEKDSNLVHRAMEYIRNHSQHYALPIVGISFTRKLTEDRKFSQQLLDIYTEIDFLEKSSREDKYKKILEDLKEKYGDQINIMFLVRKYLESLGSIHEKAREILKEDITIWEKTIRDTMDEYEKQGYDPQVFTLEKWDDDLQNLIEKTDIFIDFITRRQYLEEKYHHLTHYSRNFITNQIFE